MQKIDNHSFNLSYFISWHMFYCHFTSDILRIQVNIQIFAVQVIRALKCTIINYQCVYPTLIFINLCYSYRIISLPYECKIKHRKRWLWIISGFVHCVYFSSSLFLSLTIICHVHFSLNWAFNRKWGFFFKIMQKTISIK
jgi:hypothetical protein